MSAVLQKLTRNDDPLYNTLEWKAMCDDEKARYLPCPSHDSNYEHMVWDFEDNGVIAYCATAEAAFRVAKALNERK